MSENLPECRDVRDCRVGDWQHVGFVYEWRGRTDPQRFQPSGPDERRRCPFDEDQFNSGQPVWKFRSQIWPGMDGHKGSWEVWLRIE